MKLKLLLLLRMMSLYAFRIFILQLVSVQLLLAMDINGQDLDKTKVSLNLTQASLTEVLVAIEQRTDFVFAYSSDVERLGKIFNINYRQTSLKSILTDLANGASLHFRQVNETITVALASAGSSSQALVQEGDAIIQVSGKVTDENGESLPGVNVVEKDMTNGTVTSVDGNYELDVSEDATLVFSFIGYETKEVVVGNQTEINVTLKESFSELGEMVVTGYQELSKERVTGSFGRITEEELGRTVSYSIVDKLEGASSGVLYDPIGVTIRGVSTLNASRLPLVVVDGFPITIDKDANDYADDAEFAAFQRALESINPNDVENITILKDAAAASIWGARAANGVIVITTKRSHSRSPEINFSTNLSMIPKPNIQDMPYANPETQFAIEKGRYDAGWFDAFLNNMDTYTYNLSDYAYTARRVMDGLLPASALSELEERMQTYDNRQEFADLFMQSGAHQQYNLSVSQNAGFNNYRFSASYDRDDPIMRQSDEDRVVLNLTNQFQLAPFLLLNLGSNLSLRKENKNGVSLQDLYSILPHQAFVDESGKYTSQTNYANTTNYYGRPFREAFYEDNPWLPYDWEYNLKREFDNKDQTVKTLDARIQGGITVKPFKDMLVIDLKYQYERSSVRTDMMNNEEMWDTRHKINQFASSSGIHPVPKGSIYDQAYNTMYSHDVLLTANFFKEFADRHQVAVLAGTEIRDEYRDRSDSRRYGYDQQTLSWATQMDYLTRYPRNMYPSNDYFIESSFSTIYNFWSRQDRYVSTFGNVSYTLDRKYDVTGSWRLDRSNMFGESPKYRQVPLWSVGLGWTINRESFFSSEVIDRLRLRGTYGASGNVDKSTSPYAIATVGGSQTNNTLQLPGAQYTNPANPELRWEKTKQLNIALEFSLLNSRINGEIEYYNKKGEDLLTNRDINSTYGFTSALINFGSMTNTGVDITLSAMVINKSDFSWRTQLIHSYNKNEVTQSDIEDISQIAIRYLIDPAYSSNRLQAGRPRYYLMSIPWGGLSDDGIPQFYQGGELHHSINTSLASNTTAFGYENLRYEGPSQAPYFGSWNNTVRFKQWELSFMATYKFGHVYLHTSPFRVTNNDLYGFAQGNLVPHYSREFEDRWQQPGDEAHTDIPRLPFEYTGTSARSVTAWYNYAVNYGSHQIFDAATIRLQRVTLSYTLNRDILPEYIKDIRFALQGRNLHTFTFNPYNEDPERIPDMYGNSLLSTQPEYTISILASF